ncbi:MAG: hypothetical protein K2G28_01505, partial [Acetatifactor sp.]|nr:hypothetical protein [Acetatifactor sp.]
MEKQVRLEQERRRARQQAMTEQVRQEIRSLSADVLALAGEMSSCRYVYEDGVRECLVGRKEKPDRDFSAPSGALGEAGTGYGAGSLREAGTGYGAVSLREAVT